MTYILEMFQHRVARNSASVPHKGAVKEKIGRFAGRHSFLWHTIAFMGVSVLMLAALFICLAVITPPMALLLGWV